MRGKPDYRPLAEWLPTFAWAAHRWASVAEANYVHRPGFDPLSLMPALTLLVEKLQERFKTPEEACAWLNSRPAFRCRGLRIRMAAEDIWDDDRHLMRAYAKALSQEAKTLDILTLRALWREARIFQDRVALLGKNSPDEKGDE